MLQCLIFVQFATTSEFQFGACSAYQRSRAKLIIDVTGMAYKSLSKNYMVVRCWPLIIPRLLPRILHAWSEGSKMGAWVRFIFFYPYLQEVANEPCFCLLCHQTFMHFKSSHIIQWTFEVILHLISCNFVLYIQCVFSIYYVLYDIRYLHVTESYETYREVS
jgi:hypothetical protein